MSQIKFGWAEVSLLPPKGRKVNAVGQFYERITDTVETPITATALAIEGDGDCAIICSCDLTQASARLTAEVKARLLGVLPTDKVIIHATHTHTAMGYADNSDSGKLGGSFDILQEMLPHARYEKLVHYEGADLLAGEEALAHLADRIAEAARLAWENRAHGCFAQGFGRAAVGMCRRVCYADGSAKMWGDTATAAFTELEGGNDSGIELLFTFTPDKRLTGVIANVACPSQVLEHRSFLSSDYWGKVKDNLRREWGEEIFVLGLCAPAGDQCPRDLVRWVEPEEPINDPNIVREHVTVRKADPSMFDLSGCARIGRRIATEIICAREEITDRDYVSKCAFAHKNMTLDIPLRRVTPTEVADAKAAINAFAEKVGDGVINYVDKAKLHVHTGTIARGMLQESVDVVPIEVHILRLGTLAFATNPFELFLDFGNQMRARSHASQTFLIQQCCGSFGYLPTAKAERGSHYSAYVSSGTTGHAGGDLLVRKTVSEINGMLAK